MKSINLHAPSTPTATASKTPTSNQQQYELDACPILLAMIRNLTFQVESSSFIRSIAPPSHRFFQDTDHAEQNGLALVKFFHQLYRRKTEFFNYAQTVEYLSFLCAIVFPPNVVRRPLIPINHSKIPFLANSNFL